MAEEEKSEGGEKIAEAWDLLGFIRIKVQACLGFRSSGFRVSGSEFIRFRVSGLGV